LAENQSHPFILFRRLKTRYDRVRTYLAELLWFRFGMALIRKIGDDDVSNLAAGIAYYAFLSLFPLLLSLLIFMSWILPSDAVIAQLETFFSQFIPGSPDLVKNSLQEFTGFRTALGVVSIVGLVWSATGVFSATSNAINRAWEISYKHPLYIKKPKEILLVLGTGLLFLSSLAASTILSLLDRWQFPISDFLVHLGTLAVAFVFSLLVFLLLNKLLPALWIGWKHIWPGALISTALFEIAKTFFVIYVNTSHSYHEIYGSIASIIILLVWIYYSAFIILLGAEFNALLFKLKREGDAFDKTNPKPELLRHV
jgi:membrane protein